MKLIVGLGNIGSEYELTRHNAGFQVVDRLVSAHQASWKRDNSLHADIATITIGNERTIVSKPTTFMNRSGEAVQAIASYYKIGIGDILIIQDEMDIATESFAFKFGGGHAGHNGIASIQQHLGTNDFARLRIGIGRPEGPIPKEDWVLGKWWNPHIADVIDRAARAVEDWTTHGLAKAMNTWNR